MSEQWAAKEGHERDVDLVFEGGGLKGIALVGAYFVLALSFLPRHCLKYSAASEE